MITAVPLEGDMPDAIAGDKGYAMDWIRQWLRHHSIRDVIPAKSNRPRNKQFSRKRYRQRNVVERCIGWLKECRRIATRYEKLAIHYLGMLKLGMIREYLKYQLPNTP